MKVRERENVEWATVEDNGSRANWDMVEIEVLMNIRRELI